MYLHNTKPPKVYSLLFMQVIWFYTHIIIVRVVLNTLLQNDEINSTANLTVTKRKILQCCSNIFDPLGFLSPITICAKLLIQELWQKTWIVMKIWINLQQINGTDDLQAAAEVTI